MAHSTPTQGFYAALRAGIAALGRKLPLSHGPTDAEKRLAWNTHGKTAAWIDHEALQKKADVFQDYADSYSEACDVAIERSISLNKQAQKAATKATEL